MSRRTITFHFTLKDGRGRLVDTSRGGDPMPFTEATGQILEGLEESLRQMAAGESRSVVVPPDKGYGLPDPTLVQKVPRARLPAAELRVGDRFQTGPDRHAPVVTVVALEGDDVTLDANHPLAGQELHFEVEVVAVRPASPEEIKDARTTD